jgi:hypothetical protein
MPEYVEEQRELVGIGTKRKENTTSGGECQLGFTANVQRGAALVV